jgi:exodeoxyribonuclease VII large subunit
MQERFSIDQFAISVSDVNLQVKALLERDPILEDLSVRGEISNLSRPASGHIYFTLKDDKSSLKCVMWRTSAAVFNDLFENGAAVIAHGRIGVYERDGAYQLYADALYPVGRGKLFEDFLRLKEKLEREGLFDPSRKKPLPALPEKIGIVTSASGAALQDMLNTIRKRWTMAEIWLAPAAVQGSEAPAELTRAFQRLVRLKPDVILIGRGGGSLEDLWAFNDEALTRQIAASPIPVISGIGHETDFTLVDFAADYRAPTPTGAAVAATPDRYELMQTVDNLAQKMNGAIESKRRKNADLLQSVRHRLSIAAPMNRIEQENKLIDQINIRMRLWAERALQGQKTELQAWRQRLETANPLAVLQRGYALVQDDQGKPVVSAAELAAESQINIRFHDGSKSAKIL